MPSKYHLMAKGPGHFHIAYRAYILMSVKVQLRWDTSRSDNHPCQISIGLKKVCNHLLCSKWSWLCMKPKLKISSCCQLGHTIQYCTNQSAHIIEINPPTPSCQYKSLIHVNDKLWLDKLISGIECRYIATRTGIYNLQDFLRFHKEPAPLNWPKNAYFIHRVA